MKGSHRRKDTLRVKKRVSISFGFPQESLPLLWTVDPTFIRSPRHSLKPSSFITSYESLRGLSEEIRVRTPQRRGVETLSLSEPEGTP